MIELVRIQHVLREMAGCIAATFSLGMGLMANLPSFPSCFDSAETSQKAKIQEANMTVQMQLTALAAMISFGFLAAIVLGAL